MIPIADAEKILKNIEVKPLKEEVPLTDSLARVLAEDILSTINMPPFDKSAMDGYAYKSGDHSPRFQVVETIAAGDIPKREIKQGQCARIMTGAMLPKGTDRVVKREVVSEEAGIMNIIEEEKVLNVCYKGEDVKIGDRVLKKGTPIRPQEVAILASMGLDNVPVYQEPKVGILTTGSEIVEPGQQLKEGQIFNSNAYSLASQARQMGTSVQYGGIAADNKEGIRESISALFDQNQVVIISGGVSMGDFDFVPGILKDLGVKLYFEKVAVKPGKPTVFGTLKNKFFFGLPGNPVSTFVIFELFVKPFLYRMAGTGFKPRFCRGVMTRDFKRKKTGRTAFIPVFQEDGEVTPIEYHGSAHIYALSGANALMEVPAGMAEVKKGSFVNVRSI